MTGVVSISGGHAARRMSALGVGPVATARSARRRAGYVATWFVSTPRPSAALWWVPMGTRPTLDEALLRLRVLRRYGPSPKAFGVRRRYGSDGKPLRATHR
ncbi:MAG TPA: DUF3291 domain-containing protein [Catenuloplanes sp.]|jgi:hypothetical protein